MELKVFLSTLLRRWPIVLIALALAGGGTYVVVDNVGPTYETVGSVLIFPPADSDGPGPAQPTGNPYLELSGLTQARDIVIRTLTSKSTRTEIEDLYSDVSFEATPDFTNSAPIILLTVEAGTRDTATEALLNIMARVPSTLARLQEGQALAERSRITSVSLTQDLEPEILRKDQIRAGILVATGVMGAGLLLIALVDQLLAVRRRRKQAEAAAAAVAAAEAEAAAATAATEPEPEREPEPETEPEPEPSPAAEAGSDPELAIEVGADAHIVRKHIDPAEVPTPAAEPTTEVAEAADPAAEIAEPAPPSEDEPEAVQERELTTRLVTVREIRRTPKHPGVPGGRPTPWSTKVRSTR